VTPAALKHLALSDPIMRRVIRTIGPCTLEPQLRRSPYEALVRAVVYQQLHGRAAAAILGRFIALFGGKAFPRPRAVLAMSTRKMRGAGLSRAKVRAIKDIAKRAAARQIPSRGAALRMTDEELVIKLTAARGVGRWTVEMLLIGTLGRGDILPVDDFGIREGFRVAYGLRKHPRPKAVHAHGERWRPHRTTAAWYLWRVADRAKRVAVAKR